MKGSIGQETIKAAEALMGVSYTPAERAQMLGNLESQVAAARSRRQVAFDNSVPAALRFDPRLPGFVMPTADGVTGLDTNPGPLPADESDIAFASVTALSGWIRTGTLTSRRLTEIYLRRIAALDPRLNCFATVTSDRARQEADAADAAIARGIYLGPLHGIPYGLKDLVDTKGIVTGWGAEPYRDRVPDQDAAVVTRLRAAGAVLVGKTSVGALAYNDLWYGGLTRNPWNIEEGSSGSSAGSASATAAGLCGFSIGTETLGSITSPSERCGTTGLRPTFGRVSRAGVMALCNSLDKIGPICRSVADTALVLCALNGGDPKDHSSIAAPFGVDAGRGISGLRLGYLSAAYGEGATPLDHAVLETVRALGCDMVEVTLPDLPYDALINLLLAEAAASFEDLTLSGQDDLLTWQDEGAWPNTFRKARFLSAVDHVQLDRLRYLVMQAVDGIFGKIDALVGPFSTGPMLVASNFTGHPCLHLRAGFELMATRPPETISGPVDAAANADSPQFRMPRGLSIWGRLFDEGTILRLGLALEKHLKVAEERPHMGN